MIIKTLSEYLADALQGTSLLEMAITRADYIKNLDNMFPQIVQNWCLIKYGTKNHIPTVNHWKTELRSYLLKLNGFNIKSSSKYNILKQHWIKKYEYHKQWQLIASELYVKFEKEGIYDVDVIDDLAKKCSDEIVTLINIISGDSNNLHTYIKDL